MNKQKLRELCKKATPGEWIGYKDGKYPDTEWYASNDDADTTCCVAVVDENGQAICLVVTDSWNDTQMEANAAFIAISNRDTVLALLDENKALLEALRQARSWIGDGENSDDWGLSRDHLTPEYAAAIDGIDAVIAKYSESAS